MDYKQEVGVIADFKPLKSPSNISEMVTKFAKVCKLRSIGVFNTSLEENSSDAAEDGSKIHPHPIDAQIKVNECGKMEILKLFETLKALKLSYVKFQEAHIPYDPEKIRAADEEVASHLESLSKIKKAFKEKSLKEANFSSVCSAEIEVKERALEKLKSRAKSKEDELVKLSVELHELQLRNKKSAKEIKEQEKESLKVLSSYSFEDVVKAVGKAIHDFAKPLIALMKVSDWDLDEAANAIQNSVVYSKRSHKKYVFDAFVSRRMFYGFSSQKICISENILKMDDPIDALIEEPQSSFAKFCRTKYLLVVHPMMEETFFGNLDHRAMVASGMHPYTPFYRAFVKMARWVWFLQGFAGSMEPKAEIFSVKQGSEFSDVYMEVPEELKEYKDTLDKGQERCKVEFMIMPGFKLQDNLIPSQVYVSKVGISKEEVGPALGKVESQLYETKHESSIPNEMDLMKKKD